MNWSLGSQASRNPPRTLLHSEFKNKYQVSKFIELPSLSSAWVPQNTLLSHFFFFIFNFIYLFIYFWLCCVFVAAHLLSLVAASGGYSSLRCTGFSLRWLLLLWSRGSRHAGFSSCGSRALEQRLSSCGARA